MANLLPLLKARFLTTNGVPLAGGKLYSYLATTTTPVVTYTDSTLSTPNANPVILDANGEANVWLDNGSYKFILADSTDVVQWTVDNVTAGSTGSASVWVNHAVVDGQAAAALTGETIDFASSSSVYFDFEVIRGTTVIANGSLAIQNLNGTGRVVSGVWLANEDHGVTWSVSQVGTIAQLKAALTTGPGSGTIKLSKRYIPV